MAIPPLHDRTAPDTGQTTSSWRVRIVEILTTAYALGEAGPGWIPATADTLTGYLDMVVGDTIAACDASAHADRRLAGDHLDRLRTAIRGLLADTIAAGTALDRSDANAWLRGEGIDTLPAAYTVTIAATLTVDVTADDEVHAGDLAGDLLADLARDEPHNPVALTASHIESINERDHPPIPRHR
jgi:hypothetical protein